MKSTNKVLIIMLLLFSIVILVSLIISLNLVNQTPETDFGSHKENLILITHAIRAYYNDHNIYPEKLENLTPLYINSVPTYRLGNETKNYSYGSSINNTKGYNLKFEILLNYDFYLEKNYCIYYSSIPDEFKCTVFGFLGETEWIKFAQINYTKFN
jgi:hypothetical protein